MPLGALGVFVVTIGAIAPAGVAHAQATVGQWTRTGSALTYTFVVPDTNAAGPEDAAVDPASGTGEAAQKPPADDAPDSGNDWAAGSRTTLAGLDLVAQRAYLRTGKNSGDTVTTPQVGQSVYLHIDFTVTAPGTTTPVGLRALLDDTLYCSGTQNGEVGAWIQWCLDPWVATTGTHTLRWELDYSKTIAETDETNNATATTWTTSTLVDLQAQRAYLRTGQNSGNEVAAPQVGQSVYFHFDFAVTAPGAASNVGLRAVFDDQVFCSGTQNGQVGAWIQWCLTPWVATAGPHTLRWELDYANEYVESNESNNTATKTWGQACVADCNHDQSVTIDDLITAVNIAFNPALLNNCPSADVNGDHEVAIDEIIMAVNAALSGCG